MDGLVTFFIVIFAATAVSLIARLRGLKAGKWFILACLLLIVALPAVFLVKSPGRNRAEPIRFHVFTLVVSAMATVVAYNWLVFSPIFVGFNCENITPHVIDVSSGERMEILSIFDFRQVSASKAVLKCEGTALWSNGTQTPIDYAMEEIRGELFFSYEGK